MNRIYFNTDSSKEKNILKAMLTEPIGEGGESLFSLMNKIGITDQQKYLLWAAIINEMQITSINPELLGHLSPIRQADINEATQQGTINTLIGIIEKYCDLPDIQEEELNKSALYENLLNKEEPSFWNESIAELAKKIYELFLNDENTILLQINDEEEKNITIKTLQDADAGNNFKENSPKWVVPWWNIDNKNYDDVRWKDEIIDILKKSNKLQYTNNHSKWITLLMPQYGRRVEIEDLNRNFWVIAEVIDGISSWIFDKSPLSDVIRKMIDETTQLWENILYLWIQIAAMNQKKDSNIRVISFFETHSEKISQNPVRYGSIPVVNAKIENNFFSIKKGKGVIFGNATEKSPLADIESYERQYSEQTLCFLPLTRVNVYHHNYYNGNLYQNLIISKLGKNKIEDGFLVGRERKIYSIVEEFDQEQYRDVIISPRPSLEPSDIINEKWTKRFSPYVYGTRLIKNKYQYAFPFSNVSSYYAGEQSVYLYGTLRTIPEIVFEKNEDGNTTLTEFKIHVYDAAAPIILGKQREIGCFNLKEIDEENSRIIMTYNRVITDKEIESSLTIGTLGEIFTKDCGDISSAYYLGELASWKEKTAQIKESKNLFKNDAVILKIGNFLPYSDGETNFQNAFFYGSFGGVNTRMTTQMRGNFTNLNEVNSQSKNYFYLPNWASYIPEFDVPDKEVVKENFCFSEKPQRIENGAQITENFLAQQGMNAIQNYILKTKNLSGHPHKDLWRMPCFFITFVGLTPWWGGRDDHTQMYWDISMACHIYKYIPAMSSLGKKETIGNNYTLAYEANPPIEFIDKDGNKVIGIVYDNGEEIGKIITYHFINRFESYYDAGPFKTSMLQNWSEGNDIFTSPGWRAIKVNGAANELEEYCRLLTIDGGEGGYAYDVKFSKNFEGIFQYYDAQKALDESHVGDFLIDPDVGTYYQVSEGKVKIINADGEITNYTQIEDGAIRAWTGRPFAERKRQTPTVREKNSRETNFLIGNNNEAPFIWDNTIKVYKPLIYSTGQTPNSRFGGWTGIYKDNEYVY